MESPESLLKKSQIPCKFNVLIQQYVDLHERCSKRN